MERLQPKDSYQTLTAVHDAENSGEVVPGVWCDVYSHPETGERDYALVTMQPGTETPLQRVVQPHSETIEAYISGKGTFTLERNGFIETFEVGSDTSSDQSWLIIEGDSIQWKAAPDSELVFAEVCYPPFQPGRYKNLS